MEMHPTVRMKLKIKQHSGGGKTRIEYPLGAGISWPSETTRMAPPYGDRDPPFRGGGGGGGSALIYHSLGNLESSRSVCPFRPGHHSLVYQRLLHWGKIKLDRRYFKLIQRAVSYTDIILR